MNNNENETEEKTEEKPADPTTAELEEAERELRAGSDLMEAGPVDRFTNLLITWEAFENQRISAQEKYRLRAELPGMDRNTLVKEFTIAKQTVIPIERRLVDLLQLMTSAEQDVLLGGARLSVEHPSIYRLVSVKPALAERLRAKLKEKLQEKLKGFISEGPGDDHHEDLAEVVTNSHPED